MQYATHLRINFLRNGTTMILIKHQEIIFKVAMYISTATIGKSTTDYLTAGETDNDAGSGISQQVGKNLAMWLVKLIN